MVILSEETLSEMCEAVVKAVNPEEVYLLGSRARGEARFDSDVDLLVVESEPFGPNRSRLDEINRVYDALDVFEVPKDILVFSREEFENWKHSLNHVIGRCHREGKRLYGGS
ncbi:MAG: hypothetical protein GHCLOJNM_00053 [bacterium]|nr:hypothetical protein [bacterium]